MRVVTLLPAATEIVCALGVDPVGVSHECDHPQAARDAPPVTASRVDPDADMATVNDQVAAARDDGGVFAIDRERLAALDPDLVVAQGTCDVCAVDAGRAAAAVEAAGLDCEVVTTDAHSLAEVFDEVEALGAALDREGRAADLVADCRERVARVAERVPDGDRPRTAVLDWADPVMVAGHWVPGLVERAGGSYGLAATGARSRPRPWSEIRDYDPEVLAVAPCGVDLAGTADAVRDLADRPGFADLAAVRAGRVYAMDGDRYVNRPGPRLVDTLDHLAWCCHPDAVDRPPADAVRPVDLAAP